MDDGERMLAKTTFPKGVHIDEADPMEILNRIALDISSELRRLVQTTPKREKQVQRQVNNILRLRHEDLDFRWDQFQFPYSSKSYKPDFISERVNVAIDVKLCNKTQRSIE